ncbi:TcpE family conjugal transfer membrane protein [Bacillus cereus]|uniref:TcpE family conjugal transfer membrane protein n=1 Tax=Bacillus cereus TaxID=1396 RepID=UPI000BF31F82|nr:TcpE family conjugal transfer membrane protein [Bacillus cereus]PEV08567.1 conjugal transfer protein [Bacillus cereus]PGM64681.1 conjugal transfer protein [Bacillus cereus]
MREKEAYNFKGIMEHPVTLYKLGKYTLPFGITLVRFVLFILIFLILLVFRDIVLKLGSLIPGLTLILFLGIPYYLSGFLTKQKYNGKKIFNFMYDFFDYFFNIYLPKRMYCNDEEVLYSNEKEVIFEEVLVNTKEDGGVYEDKNTIQDSTQKSDAHKVG